MRQGLSDWVHRAELVVQRRLYSGEQTCAVAPQPVQSAGALKPWPDSVAACQSMGPRGFRATSDCLTLDTDETRAIRSVKRQPFCRRPRFLAERGAFYEID